jgi:hypothetical protein
MQYPRFFTQVLSQYLSRQVIVFVILIIFIINFRF